MKLNIVLLIIATLLVVDATEMDSMRRELRKGGGSSRSSTKSSTKSTSTKTYKKTTYTYVNRYTGTFVGGRTNMVLVHYYLPPYGYYQTGGYYSSYCNKLYYNGYGWNFYTQTGNYYGGCGCGGCGTSGGGG